MSKRDVRAPSTVAGATAQVASAGDGVRPRGNPPATVPDFSSWPYVSEVGTRMGCTRTDDGFAVVVDDSEAGSPAVIHLIGELDLATCPDAQTTIATMLGGAQAVVLDLSRVTFFSAAGITMLLALHDVANAEASTLVVRETPPVVTRLLDLTGATSRLNVVRGAIPEPQLAG